LKEEEEEEEREIIAETFRMITELERHILFFIINMTGSDSKPNIYACTDK